MLIVKAHAVVFTLEGGKRVRAPARWGMLHDEYGSSWPRCSVLVMPYPRGKRAAALTDKARRYYGPGWQATESLVALPPRQLDHGWEHLGDITRVEYTRHGNVFGGKRFGHTMATRRFVLFKVHVCLYRHASASGILRMEMPKGCVVNWRGFVTP